MLWICTLNQFSHSVVSNSLWAHGLQHSRLPCPSPTLRACSNSCPLSWWCHPTISSSVIPFSSCLQSFPASAAKSLQSCPTLCDPIDGSPSGSSVPALGSFPLSQFFASGSQSIGVSASAPVLPMNILDWSPLGLTGLISLQPKGLSRIFSNTTVQKGYKHLWQRVLTPKRKQSAMESIRTLT